MLRLSDEEFPMEYNQPAERMLYEILVIVRQQRDRIELLEMAVSNLAKRMQDQENDGR